MPCVIKTKGEKTRAARIYTNTSINLLAWEIVKCPQRATDSNLEYAADKRAFYSFAFSLFFSLAASALRSFLRIFPVALFGMAAITNTPPRNCL